MKRNCFKKKAIICMIALFVIINAQVDPNYNYDDFMRQFDRKYEGI